MIKGERIYATFFALLSCLVFGFTLNQIGQIISNNYMNSAQIRRKQAIIDEYMKQRNVSPDLQMQVKKNIEYIYNEKGQQDKLVDEIINNLTTSLKNELKVELYKKLLKGVQSFHFNFSDQFLYELSMQFKEQTFSQEHQIYAENEISDRLYYIIKGEVEIYYQSNKCPIVVKENEILGLEEFFSQQSRQMTSKASIQTTVAYINYKDFIEVLKKHQLDQETYRMIFDSINLNGYTSRIQIKCYNCNSLTHKFLECPYIFFQKDERLFRENKLLKNSLIRLFEMHENRQPFERKKKKKISVYSQMIKLWEQLFRYLINNIEDLDNYYNIQVEKYNKQILDSLENDSDEDNENYEDYVNEDGQIDEKRIELIQTNQTSEEEIQNSPFAAIKMLKSQNRKTTEDINTGKRKIDAKSAFAQYFFAGRNRSSSNIQIDLQQFVNQSQVITTVEANDSNQNVYPNLPIDLNNIKQISKLDDDGKNQSYQQQSQNLLINSPQTQDYSSNINNRLKDETVQVSLLPINKLIHNPSQKSTSQNSNFTLNNVNQQQNENQSFQNIFYNLQTDTKLISPFLQSPSFLGNNQSSQFPGLDKSSNMRKEEQYNQQVPQPQFNTSQQTGEIEQSTLSAFGEHHIPQSQNNYLLMVTDQIYQTPSSGIINNNKHSPLVKNEQIQLTGQEDNSQISQLNLDPILPTKSKSKTDQEGKNQKIQLLQGSPQSNSVSIKIDELQDYQQKYYLQHVDKLNLNRENSNNQSQVQIQKINNQKNPQKIEFGSKMNPIQNSDFENQTFLNGSGSNYQINPLNLNYPQNTNNQTQGTIGTNIKSSDENKITSNSNIISSINDNSNGQIPLLKGRSKSTKKNTYFGIFDEQLQSIKNGADKEKVLALLKRQTKSSSSQKNIDLGYQFTIQGNRKQTRDKSIINPKPVENLSQSQDIPNNPELPKLQKHQSARARSPLHKALDNSLVKQMELHSLALNKNRQTLDYFNNAYQQNLSPKQTPYQQNTSYHKNGKHQQDQQMKYFQNQKSIDSKIQNLTQRKQTLKKISWKNPDNAVTSPTHAHRKNQQKSFTKLSLSSNSQPPSQTLIPFYNIRDEENESEDESTELFCILPEFETLKAYKVYFPWNNYTRIIKNIQNPKKKKQKDLLSLLTSQKFQTKLIKSNYQFNNNNKTKPITNS